MPLAADPARSPMSPTLSALRPLSRRVPVQQGAERGCFRSWLCHRRRNFCRVRSRSQCRQGRTRARPCLRLWRRQRPRRADAAGRGGRGRGWGSPDSASSTGRLGTLAAGLRRRRAGRPPRNGAGSRRSALKTEDWAFLPVQSPGRTTPGRSRLRAVPIASSRRRSTRSNSPPDFSSGREPRELHLVPVQYK